MRPNYQPFRSAEEFADWEAELNARAEQALVEDAAFRLKLKLAEESRRDDWRVQDLLDDTSIPPRPVTVADTRSLWRGMLIAGAFSLALWLFIALWLSGGDPVALWKWVAGKF